MICFDLKVLPPKWADAIGLNGTKAESIAKDHQKITKASY